MSHYKLLLISGSLRAEATNTKLLREAARVFGTAEVELADLNLPLYDGDLEERSGIPEQVQFLAEQIVAADAILIATPEYNKAPSGVLKNALDWVSRTKAAPWTDKPVAVMSAAAGRGGGAQAEVILRSMMQPFMARVVPGPAVNIAASYEQFDDKGHLVSERYAQTLTDLMSALRKEIGR
ncbi:NADPH-dependent FMN reductase [Epibacterium ulvae]|uniref:NADPH-dependent FMN reductase n=1 Tax=Epibacterium ulvae TaxID=1156985 RepID=UPI0024925D52|nr:NAD(P)H-dependent oxidoreductase [Epibacterium ulvae]